MSRPRGFADLSGLRVGILGYGVEGRAAERRLGEWAGSVVLVDDHPAGPGVLRTESGGHQALLRCDVVLKTPGVPRRREDVLELERAGVVVTSALNLWLGETDRSRVIAVTGTKGKSTTTALVAFALTCLGETAAAAGNFGPPPYDPDFPDVEWIALEVSSYQAVDVEWCPGVVAVTSLGEDHLDWHGSVDQYHRDKLSLTRAAGDHVTLVPDDDAVLAERPQIGGEVVVVSPESPELTGALHLIGGHNASNLALAIAAAARATGRGTEATRDAVSCRAADFSPLPGRLSVVGREGGVRFVDDGLATGPLPTSAALAAVGPGPIALIVGGYDRGVDYGPLARSVADHRVVVLVAMPDAGARIAAAVGAVVPIPIISAESMLEAVSRARDALVDGGVVLFSPAAPSFGRYRDWRERSDDFAHAVSVLTGRGSAE